MPSSLLTLLDDITSVLDDVALLTKTATKQTAGVLGDDLALNAQQVTGVEPKRELPVVWAVAKGSLLNKAILVPAALGISAFAPWGITPLLMLGGLFLCFEGVEKLAHKLLHSADERGEQARALSEAAQAGEVDLAAFEKDKVKGAIRTDFILSAEIIVITLGTVADEPFGMRLTVLAGIAVLMTAGVYGLVAGIVKIDDAGLYLSKREGGAKAFGEFLLRAAPWLMKFLSIAGTAAMFLVGGGIVVHAIEVLHHAVEHAGEWAMGVHPALGWLIPQLANAGIGIAAGAVLVAVFTGIEKLVAKLRGRGD
ncbi:DUF808 domain-containing protein [Pseudenhygromyxa sp. WMMC2535]|nr:DUF808 domain-containing protein [Pseudenhygromyxa sp. WMMC2535]